MNTCAYCGSTVQPDDQSVQLSIGGITRTYHGSPRPGDQMSCWQWEVYMQSFSLSVTNDLTRAERHVRASAA